MAARAWGRGLARAAWYWLPLAAYAGAIFALSAMAHPPVPRVALPHFDKVLHFAEYAGLGLLLFRALEMGGQGLPAARALGATVLLGALYGASDEVHQMLVPPRDADLADLLADVLGASFGAGLYAWAAARRRRRRSAT